LNDNPEIRKIAFFEASDIDLTYFPVEDSETMGLFLEGLALVDAVAKTKSEDSVGLHIMIWSIVIYY